MIEVDLVKGLSDEDESPRVVADLVKSQNDPDEDGEGQEESQEDL